VVRHGSIVSLFFDLNLCTIHTAFEKNACKNFVYMIN